MYLSKTVAVVVPAYNEEKLIARVIETMPDLVDRIVVVDDCSADATVAIVEQYREQQPERIVLVRHPRNQGVGGAIASGYIWCRDHGIDVAVVMAGDAQMDPADLPALLEPVASGAVDYAKGNRLFTGEAWKLIPRTRYLGNSALSLMTKIASGYWHVADSQTGYTAINRKALETIDWTRTWRRYGQPNDLLVRLNINSFKVRDVPVKPIYNIGETSGIRPLRIIPRLTRLLTRLFFMRMLEKYVIRDFHPLVFFYAIGLLLGAVAAPLLLLRMLCVWWTVGSIPEINALALMVSLIAATQFLLFAMWFDMEYNKDLR